VSVAAIYCSALDVPVNGFLSTRQVRYQTLVQLECMEGFVFPNGKSSYFLECIESSDEISPHLLSWNGTVSNCQGRVSKAEKCRHLRTLLN